MNDSQNDEELKRLAHELGASVIELESRLELVASAFSIASCTIDAQCYRAVP